MKSRLLSIKKEEKPERGGNTFIKNEIMISGPAVRGVSEQIWNTKCEL